MSLQRPRTWMGLLRDPDITVLLERWKLLAVFFLTDKLASPQDFCTSKVCRRRYRKSKERKKERNSRKKDKSQVGRVLSLWQVQLVVDHQNSFLLIVENHSSMIINILHGCPLFVLTLYSLLNHCSHRQPFWVALEPLFSSSSASETGSSPSAHRPHWGLQILSYVLFLIFETLDRFPSSGMEGI